MSVNALDTQAKLLISAGVILQQYYICLNFSAYSLFTPFFCQKILSEKFLKVIIKA